MNRFHFYEKQLFFLNKEEKRKTNGSFIITIVCEQYGLCKTVVFKNFPLKKYCIFSLKDC